MYNWLSLVIMTKWVSFSDSAYHCYKTHKLHIKNCSNITWTSQQCDWEKRNSIILEWKGSLWRKTRGLRWLVDRVSQSVVCDVYSGCSSSVSPVFVWAGSFLSVFPSSAFLAGGHRSVVSRHSTPVNQDKSRQHSSSEETEPSVAHDLLQQTFKWHLFKHLGHVNVSIR